MLTAGARTMGATTGARRARSLRATRAALAYGLAIGAAAVSLLGTAVLEQPLGGAYFFAPVAAIVLVALYLGFGPSLAALVFTWVGYAYLFLPPRGTLALGRVEDGRRLLGYAATSLLLAWVATRLQTSKAAEREAGERLQALAASERRTREMYERLQAATAACSAARTVGEIAFALMEAALAHLRPVAVNLATLDEQGDLRIVFSEGIPEPELNAFPRIPVDAPLPAAECARTRALVTAVGADEIDRRYPGLAELRARVGFASLASIPMTAAGELQAVLGIAFHDARALDDEERHYLGALADQAAQGIARARSYEAELRARAEAERIGRVKEQLLAIVGHDLRSPLSAIVGSANVMARRGGLSPEQEAILGRITRSADRMSSVIHDLLDFSRVRQGLGIPVQFAPVDLGEVAGDVLLEVEGRRPAGGIDLHATGDLRLEGDAQRLAQVLSNLVGNAIQHGAGSAVRVEMRGEPQAVVVRVHNGGPAIDPQVLPHVFEPFRRGVARADAAPDPSGSIGLGLFIVNAVVRAHAGRIEVQSRESEGTTFTLTLPRRREQAQGPAERAG